MPLPEEISSQLPEDIRGHESLASFNDLGGLAKSYIETKSMVGSSVRLPGRDAKPEDLDKWAGETGAKLKDYGYTVAKHDPVPDKPDGYEFKIEGVDPEMVKKDPALAAFKPVAHELGLSNAKAGKLVDWFLKDGYAKIQEAQRAGAPAEPEVDIIEDQDKIKTLLGERFKGETPQKLEAADKAVTVLSASIPELKDFLEGTAPNGKSWMPNRYHPGMVALLAEVERMTRPGFNGGMGGASGHGGKTLADIDTEIADLRANKDLPRDEIGRRLVPLYQQKQSLMTGK